MTGEAPMPPPSAAPPAFSMAAFWRSVSGIATIELAATLFVLTLLAFGAYDFGRLGIEQARLTSAARAGAQYAMQSQGAAAELDAVIAAARADAGDSEGDLDVTARQFCRCAGGGESACEGNCADGAYPPLYLEVTVADAVQTLIDYPGMSRTVSLSASSVTRVR